jgi:hypothetical protein
VSGGVAVGADGGGARGLDGAIAMWARNGAGAMVGAGSLEVTKDLADLGGQVVLELLPDGRLILSKSFAHEVSLCRGGIASTPQLLNSRSIEKP